MHYKPLVFDEFCGMFFCYDCASMRGDVIEIVHCAMFFTLQMDGLLLFRIAVAQFHQCIPDSSSPRP